MSSVSKKAVDLEFVDAFYQEIRICERTWEVDITCEVLASARKGVLVLQLAAHERGAGRGFLGAVARYTTEWPNSHTSTMPAALYQAACKLDLLVQGFRTQQHERRAATGG